MLKTLFFIAAFASVAGAASAQLLPGAGETLGQAVPNTLGAARDTAQGALNTTTETLRNARETAAGSLVREHRDVIDTDPHGFPVVRHEVVAIAPTEAAIATARARRFSVSETVESRELGLTVTVLIAPPGMTTRRALAVLHEIDPQGAYDYNHIYFGAGSRGGAPKLAAESRGSSANRARVGLIDSGVDGSHPAFTGVALEQRGFAGPHALADAHGTAVASLITSADPGAALFVADVYGRQATGGGVVAIISAMAWLAQSHAAVINVSLVGPPNRALETAVRAAVTHGMVVVAAVGNDGPSAPPLYPASYPGVIGVTGVDAQNRVLPEAGRGAQVDFAAPGSELTVAAPGGRYTVVRGTSFASPIVAGLIARDLDAANGAAQAEAALARSATDLGARGVDRIYGAGLVGSDLRNAMQTLARR